jgi:hypothetical protein
MHCRRLRARDDAVQCSFVQLSTLQDENHIFWAGFWLDRDWRIFKTEIQFKVLSWSSVAHTVNTTRVTVSLLAAAFNRNHAVALNLRKNSWCFTNAVENCLANKLHSWTNSSRDELVHSSLYQLVNRGTGT